MAKIIPTIFNGKYQLLISETFCCIPSLGIRLNIPISNNKFSNFEFDFYLNEKQQNRSVQVNQIKSDLYFALTNFFNPLGTAFIEPFKFKIGEENFLLQIYGTSIHNDFLNLTISIFKELNA